MLQMLSVTSTLALSQKAEKRSVISKPQYNPPGSLYCSRVREEEIETWRSYTNSPKSYSNDNNKNDWKLTMSSTTADYQISARPFYNKPCWYALLNIHNSLCDHTLAKKMEAKVYGYLTFSFSNKAVIQ